MIEWLKSQSACAEAIAWCGERSAREAYTQCERADWLLWALGQIVDRQLLVLAACACARRALQYVPAGEMRPLRAIETAERWSRGGAKISEVQTAADAAGAAAVAAAWAAEAEAAGAAAVAAAWAAEAAEAARAAAWAAYAAKATAGAAYAAKATAGAAADAVDDAAWAAAHAATDAAAEHAAMCTLIRDLIPFDERWIEVIR